MLSPASNLEELLEQMHEVFKGVNKTVGDLEAKVMDLPTQSDLNRMEKAVKAETHDDVKEQIGYVRQAILSDVQGALQPFKDSLNQHRHEVGEMIRDFREQIPGIVDKRMAKTVDEAIKERNDAARERWVKRVKQASVVLAFAGLLATTLAQCAGYQLPHVKEKSEQFGKLGR